jgi:glycosyltransferase involved in cell wall biosynthesis
VHLSSGASSGSAVPSASVADLYQFQPRGSAMGGTASYAALLARMWSDCGGATLATIDSRKRALETLPPHAAVLVHAGTNDFESSAFLKQARKSRPDLRRIILAHDPPFLARSKNRWMDAMSRHRPGRGVRKLINALFEDHFDRGVIHENDVWVAMSAGGAGAVRERLQGLGLPSANVHVVPHGLHVRDPLLPRRTRPQRLRVGFFGHISPTKGLRCLVDAAGLLRANASPANEVQFVVAGAPDSDHSAQDLEKTRTKIRANGLERQFSFLGALSDSALPEFFAGVDMLALPYLRPQSLAASGPMHWAWSFGVPVMASRSCYFEEIIGTTGAGMLAAAGDATAWCEGLSIAATSTLSWEAMSAGVERAQSINTWPAVVAKLGAIIASGGYADTD